MSRTITQPKSVRIGQDATLDLLSSGKLETKTIRKIPLSLRPDARVMLGAAMGERHSMAIRDSWKPNHRITVMQPAEFDALVARCSTTTFHGIESDIDGGR